MRSSGRPSAKVSVRASGARSEHRSGQSAATRLAIPWRPVRPTVPATRRPDLKATGRQTGAEAAAKPWEAAHRSEPAGAMDPACPASGSESPRWVRTVAASLPPAAGGPCHRVRAPPWRGQDSRPQERGQGGYADWTSRRCGVSSRVVRWSSVRCDGTRHQPRPVSVSSRSGLRPRSAGTGRGRPRSGSRTGRSRRSVPGRSATQVRPRGVPRRAVPPPGHRTARG